MIMRRFNLIAGFFFLFMTFPAFVSADIAKGEEAYKNKDYAAAYAAWLPDAEAGNAYAQHRIGYLYEKGRGPGKNREEAVRWYRLAAEQGYAPAQTDLGKKFEKGRGVEKNKKEAERWYRMAAEQGDPKAQYALGWLLYRRGGVKSRSVSSGAMVKGKGYKYKVKGNDKNQVEGYMWISMAAAQGGSFGMANAKMQKASLQETMDATTLFKGQRLLHEKKGNEEIVRLNQMADSGHAGAQYELGRRYAQGDGVTKKIPSIAYHWMNLAYANGIEDARKPRKRLCKKVLSNDERMGPPGLNYLAIEHFEEHPQAYPDGRIKPILKNLCS